MKYNGKGLSIGAICLVCLVALSPVALTVALVSIVDIDQGGFDLLTISEKKAIADKNKRKGK